MARRTARARTRSERCPTVAASLARRRSADCRLVDDELGAAAILYAIEAGQPAISETKLRGLLEHYGFSGDSPAVEYFAVHGERDHEHAAEARAKLEGVGDERLVHLAESALAANWALLDGVSQN